MSAGQAIAKPTRERILRAVAELIGTVPTVEAVTVEAIARRANVSKATLYHHFGSKESLLMALDEVGVDLTKLGMRDRRGEVLDAALQIFGQNGFHATTMEQVAEAAGVSKGAIYWYFKDKKELFQAVVSHLSPLLKQLPSLVGQMDSPPEDVLPLIARTYLSTFNNPDARQLFRILMSEAPRIAETASVFADSIMPMLDFVVAYLEHQVKQGRLKPHDVQSSARAFMSTLVLYIMSSELFLPMRASLPEPERYVREVVAIFLSGLRTGKEQA